MKIPVSLGGSGGSGSDDCTAKASQVLTPYTAITSESDDEPIYGTMQDYAGTTQSGTSSLDTTNSRVRLSIPNEGRYTTASYIYQTYSNIASLIGLTSAKVATGSTVLGVSGSYTGVGTAAAAQVLSGYTFSNASSSGISGSMTNKAGTTTSATASLDTSNSRVRMAVPTTGYYNTSAYLYTSYSSMASVIGLTAAKIKYGETILGITGTWQGWVATSGDLYYNGSVGSLGGSMNTYTANGGSITTQSSCVLIDMASNMSFGNADGGWCGGISFSTAINCAGYDTLKISYNTTQATTATSSRFTLGLYASRPTSASAFDTSNAYAYTYSSMGTEGSRSLTLDISGYNSTMYVGIGCYVFNSTSRYYKAELTRVSVS